MIKESENDKFEQLKRKIYLIALPILILTIYLYWLYSPNVNQFMQITAIPTAILLIMMWIFVLKRRFVGFFELYVVMLSSVYYIVRVYTMTAEIAQGGLNVYMFWSPIFYIYIFMVLERKKALILSAVIFSLCVGIGFNLAHTVRTQDIMLQFYLSSLVYIFVLYYFKQVVTAYIESDILMKNAYFDHLTNIGNRRSLDNWLKQYLIDFEKMGSSFSVIYFDIDHFKTVNDVYGHEIGDQVLKEFSTVIAENLLVEQYFGRWGGEEFMVISPTDSLEQAMILAESLRQKIETHEFQHVNHITASFGVTICVEGDTIKSITRKADEALYFAKKNGRNIVSTAFKDAQVLLKV